MTYHHFFNVLCIAYAPFFVVERASSLYVFIISVNNGIVSRASLGFIRYNRTVQHNPCCLAAAAPLTDWPSLVE